jgi:hypothetical protein
MGDKMKHVLKFVAAFLIALNGFPAAVQSDMPKTMDFIFLIDVSGSMEFSFDGDYPVDPSEQRISYIRESLEALGPIIQTISIADPGSPFENVNAVRFAFAIFPGDPPDSPVEVSWLNGTATSLDAWSQAEYDNTRGSLSPRWAGTPIISALNAAYHLWGPWDPGADPPSDLGKVIFLLTDGKRYGGDPELDFKPDDENIKIGAILIGSEWDLAETDLPFLNSLGPLLSDGTRLTATVFDIIDDVQTVTGDHVKNLFGVLEWANLVDPTFIMTRESKETFDVEVTEYDQYLFFITSWHEPRDTNKVAFTIEAPGATLTPESLSDGVKYSEGSTYQMYSVAPGFLAAHLGTWKLVIDGSTLPPQTRQITSYLVGGPSELQINQDSPLKVKRLFTGDSLLLAFHVSARGAVVPNAKMKVEIKMPAESAGNWFARNTLTKEELQRVRNRQFPGHVEDSSKKSHYLRFTKQVKGPDRTVETLELFDDGTHGDQTSGDGIFSNSLRNIKTPGLYSVQLLVEGETPGGSRFTRELTQNFLVEPKIEANWTASSLDVRLVTKTKAGALYQLTFTPRDRFGNYLEPGHGDDITINLSPGVRPEGELEDDLQGSYIQRVEVDADAEDPTVHVVFEDKRFTPRPLLTSQKK